MCDDSDRMEMTMAVKMKTESLIKDRILEVNTSEEECLAEGCCLYRVRIIKTLSCQRTCG